MPFQISLRPSMKLAEMEFINAELFTKTVLLECLIYHTVKHKKNIIIHTKKKQFKMLFDTQIHLKIGYVWSKHNILDY